MKRAMIDGVELEYQMKGSGEPVLLIEPVIPGAFVPFMSAAPLAERYRLIRYHRRGWKGSTHPPTAASIRDHATDAAGLLTHLGVSRAHVVGHSIGGTIALQLAADQGDLVHSLTLLEPTVMSVPSAVTLLERAAPAFAAYQHGRPEAAVATFLSLVSGFDWPTCRSLIDSHIPGGVGDTIRDAETFFGVELPSLVGWGLGRDQIAAIDRPVFSVLGSDTGPVWVEVAALVRSWFPQLEQLTLDGVGHLMQMQRPDVVVRGVADFLARHRMAPEVAAAAAAAAAG